MSSLRDLKAALEAFETTLLQTAGSSDKSFPARRKGAIEQRRQIATHRNEVARLLQRVDATATLPANFRTRFSEFCSALAQHQATWPVVAIDVENSEYLASRAVTRAKYQDFFAWVKLTLREV